MLGFSQNLYTINQTLLFYIYTIVSMMDYLTLCKRVLCESTEPVKNALEAEFVNEFETNEIDVLELLYEACEQVAILRNQVRQYRLNGSQEAFKPCINYRLLANRIVERLSERHKVRYVDRANAYKVLFMTYLVCEVVAPLGKRDWWENTYKDNLASYLESTNYFEGVHCMERWSVILNQIPNSELLPLDVELKIPAPKPQYPPLNPVYIQVFRNPQITSMTNEKCMQFYGQ